MKSKGNELPNPSPSELGSVENDVHDFLYVDQPRVSALYAQLFPQGTLTGVKTTSQQGSTGDNTFGSDIKILKAETKSSSSAIEGIEHTFDPSWLLPLEVIAGLTQRSLLRTDLKNPQLGTVILLPGYLRVIDYASMKDLWEPMMALVSDASQTSPTVVQAMLSIFKALPHTIHAHMLTHQGYLWSSLEPSYLTVPTADIILKHGGTVSGKWQMVFVVDAFPDKGEPPDFSGWSAGDFANAILTTMYSVRAQMGKAIFLVRGYTANDFPLALRSCATLKPLSD